MSCPTLYNKHIVPVIGNNIQINKIKKLDTIFLSSLSSLINISKNNSLNLL